MYSPTLHRVKFTQSKCLVVRGEHLEGFAYSIFEAHAAQIVIQANITAIQSIPTKSKSFLRVSRASLASPTYFFVHRKVIAEATTQPQKKKKKKVNNTSEISE
jgi:hypothetical protein